MTIESFQTIGKDFEKEMLASSGKSDPCKIPEIRALKGNSVLMQRFPAWNDTKEEDERCSIEPVKSEVKAVDNVLEQGWVNEFHLCGRVKNYSTNYKVDRPKYQSSYSPEQIF